MPGSLQQLIDAREPATKMLIPINNISKEASSASTPRVTGRRRRRREV
jgi:hypothetical protein